MSAILVNDFPWNEICFRSGVELNSEEFVCPSDASYSRIAAPATSY